MQLQINNLQIFVQAMSLIFAEKNIYIQWYIMEQDVDNNWIVPVNAPCIIGIIADPEGYDPFLAMNNADQNTALNNYLLAKYPAPVQN